MLAVGACTCHKHAMRAYLVIIQLLITSHGINSSLVFAKHKAVSSEAASNVFLI